MVRRIIEYKPDEQPEQAQPPWEILTIDEIRQNIHLLRLSTAEEVFRVLGSLNEKSLEAVVIRRMRQRRPEITNREFKTLCKEVFPEELAPAQVREMINKAISELPVRLVSKSSVTRLESQNVDSAHYKIPAELAQIHQKAIEAFARLNPLTVHHGIVKRLIHQYWGIDIHLLSKEIGKSPNSIRTLLNYANLTLREHGVEIIARNGVLILVEAKNSQIDLPNPEAGGTYGTYAQRIAEKDELEKRLRQKRKRKAPKTARKEATVYGKPSIQQPEPAATVSTRQLDEITQSRNTLLVENIELKKEPARLKRRIDQLLAQLEKARTDPPSLARRLESLQTRYENLKRRRASPVEHQKPEETSPNQIYTSYEDLPIPPHSPKLSTAEIEENIKALTNEAPDNTETTSWIGGLITDAHAEAEKDRQDADLFTQEERKFLKVLINQYHGLSLKKISELTGLQEDKIAQLTENLNEKFRDFQRVSKITIQNGIAIITLVTGNIFLLTPKPE